jgi:hypothetical protein
MGKQKGIQKVDPDNSLALPDYLAEEEVIGTEDLGKHIIPPRVKIVQKQASKELLEQYSPGDVILVPVGTVLAEPERDTKGRIKDMSAATFRFTPVFFFVEYCTWSDIKLKGQEPAILYRTFDPQDPVAVKARNAKLRVESHPQHPGMKVAHAEHLNFVIALHDHELCDQPMVLSFLRGSHSFGSTLASRIKARRAPIMSCVFDATLTERRNNQGEWFVLDCDNPKEGSPYVMEEQFKALKEIHGEYKSHYDEATLRVEYDEQVEADPAETAESDEY